MLGDVPKMLHLATSPRIEDVTSLTSSSLQDVTSQTSPNILGLHIATCFQLRCRHPLITCTFVCFRVKTYQILTHVPLEQDMNYNILSGTRDTSSCNIFTAELSTPPKDLCIILVSSYNPNPF
jgi:hypothetical protein